MLLSSSLLVYEDLEVALIIVVVVIILLGIVDVSQRIDSIRHN